MDFDCPKRIQRIVYYDKFDLCCSSQTVFSGSILPVRALYLEVLTLSNVSDEVMENEMICVTGYIGLLLVTTLITYVEFCYIGNFSSNKCQHF